MHPPNNQDRIHAFFRRITGNQGKGSTYSTYGSIQSGNRALAYAIVLAAGALLIPLAFWVGSVQLQRCQSLYDNDAASVRYRRYGAECYDGKGGIAPL
jgi:hypothetical protein